MSAIDKGTAIHKALEMLDSLQPTIYLLHFKFDGNPNRYTYAFSTRLNRAIFEDQFESKYISSRNYQITRSEVLFNAGLKELEKLIEKVK